MPEGYEKLRDSLYRKKPITYRQAQKKAAKIWNSKHPDYPVGRHKKKGK